jgi:hypothetical protein
MPQGPEVKRPLLTVLEELSWGKLGLVLAQGTDYYRIEQVAGRARREAKSGHPDVQVYLSAPVFWWDEDPDGKVIVFEQTSAGPRPIAAEVGAREIPLALGDEGDWGRDSMLSGSLGKVKACDGAVFERRCYTPGEIYSFDDLPSRSRRDAVAQTADFQSHFDHSPKVMSFRFLVIPHQDVMRVLQERFGTDLQKKIESSEVRSIAQSIEREGLKFPPVADEGWKRTLAIALLGRDLPYFEVIPPFDMPVDPMIPTLEGRRWASGER